MGATLRWYRVIKQGLKSGIGWNTKSVTYWFCDIGQAASLSLSYYMKNRNDDDNTSLLIVKIKLREHI